jgi:membrane protein implicated in regulation of membrane protease activity
MTSAGIGAAAILANLTLVFVGGPVAWVAGYFAALVIVMAMLRKRDRGAA